MRVVGLFAGIGGIEEGFRRTYRDRSETLLLSEVWEPAQVVLRDRFAGAPLHPDVRDFDSLPRGTELLSAGFPCTDLSQAGRTAGIKGDQSGLVSHVFAALERSKRRGQRLPWLLIENVSNMLVLDGGDAMSYLVRELERLGYSWAYRTVDSRFTGVPQRRRRVILLASVDSDPGAVLFADDAGDPHDDRYRPNAYGFYWTEGLRGLGWAVDAIPTLKGGSTLGIPSPPAIWVPSADVGRKLLWPTISDAEKFQGFPEGWTLSTSDGRRDGDRWKLVGNAVTVGVSEWVAERIREPGSDQAAREPITKGWPRAGAGSRGKKEAVRVSEFPIHAPYTHLLDLVDVEALPPMSLRATRGFLNRLTRGNLGRFPGFREDVAEHARVLEEMGSAIA